MAAIFASQSAGLAQRDRALAMDTRANRVKEYGDRAMGFLHRMRDMKFYRPLYVLDRTPQFAPIRQREDFRALVAEMGKVQGR